MKVTMKCVHIKLCDMLDCFHYILNAPRMYQINTNVCTSASSITASIRANSIITARTSPNVALRLRALRSGRSVHISNKHTIYLLWPDAALW